MGGLSTASLSELLRGFRTRAGLTQAALAEKAGLSEQAISVLERGTRSRPRIDTVRSLTAALGLNANEAEQFLAVARSKGQGQRSGRAATAEPAIAAETFPVPWQLPPAAPDFTGRAAQIEAMLSALRNPSGTATVGAVAVTGMGGIGKTALAVQVARKLPDSYPDGHLYLNLRGYGPGNPMSVADAQRHLLRSVGLDVQNVPEDIEEAAALLRSQLAGRRVLMLLDNAADARQVLPLLPGSQGSAAIITSRGSLAHLPGARQIRLDALSESESIELLTEVIGQPRAAAEPAATKTLTAFSGRLPLAIRLIGGRLATRPTWPIQHLVTLLQDEERRLDGLGSDETGVRASIASSVDFLETSDQSLDREAARALPLLSVPDGSDVLTIVAAHLLDVPIHRADTILERLVDLNLLESAAPERYRFHDLVRVYARERAEQDLTLAERDAGLERILRFYTEFGWACQSRSHPHNPRLALATMSFTPATGTADNEVALRWLDSEQRNVMDRYHQAAGSSLASTAILPELALSLFGYHESRSRWVEMRETCRDALDIAKKLDLGSMAAWLEHDNAIPEVENGSLEAAATHLLNALDMFRALSDRRGQARCCTSAAHVLGRLGRLTEALELGTEALRLSRELEDKTVEGVSYIALGGLYDRNGDYALADEAHQHGIALAEESGDVRSMAKRYLNAGFSHLLVGRIDDAVEPLLRSIEAGRRARNNDLQAHGLQCLAAAYALRGEFDRAHKATEEGLELLRPLGNRLREGCFVLEHGKISAAAGDFPAATRHLGSAIAILHNIAPQFEAEAQQLLELVRHRNHYTYRFNDDQVQ